MPVIREEKEPFRVAYYKAEACPIINLNFVFIIPNPNKPVRVALQFLPKLSTYYLHDTIIFEYQLPYNLFYSTRLL